MPSSTFTPSDAVDMSKEREWSSNLGMLDWDATKIVFTKRSLIEFLKYTGTTVDTNFGNIQKLPKYAQFGKFAANSEELAATEIATEAVLEKAATTTILDGFKPTRRVRTVPGGPSTDIFGNSVDDGVLATAPPKEPQNTNATATAIPEPRLATKSSSTETNPSAPQPSSSLSNFWDAEETTSFKPTRRVRQVPGGQDNVSGIF